jgi:hypothetical protein
VSNYAKTGAENLRQASFFWQELIVPAGQTEALQTYYWTRGDSQEVGDSVEGWVRMAAPPDANTILPAPTDRGAVPWRRNTRAHYFNINDLSADGRFNDPLDGSTEPPFVHLKDYEVEVEGVQESSIVLGQRRRIIVRTLKAF